MAALNESDPPRDGSGWPPLRWFRRVFSDVGGPHPDRGRVATPVDADSHLGSLRVLVVDDDDVNLLIASEMLSAWGITPLLAADGAEAAAFARERSLDLILMDLHMPVLDGLASARQIRAVEREFASKRVPIVAYTSGSLVETSLQDSGIDGLLAKPCGMRELRGCLMRWCPPKAGARVSSPGGSVVLDDRFRGSFASGLASGMRDGT